MKKIFIAIIAFFIALTPSLGLACACGCSLFDVGTSSLIPTQKGGLVFAQYDYLEQNKNWHNSSRGDDANNEDKKITTRTITAGGQYMFNRQWGVMARAPYVERNLKSTMQNDEGDEMMATTSHNSIGDVKLTGIYSGFSADMSSGLIFGAKLPTGATKQNSFESHMQIGTGSYDAIVGFYHLGKIPLNNSLGWFAQGTLQKPVITKADYHVGRELSASLGGYYNLGQFAFASKIAPMLQIIATSRSKDGGANADVANSGYSRAFIAPGVEIAMGKFKLYADIELPIYENVNGNQLAVAKIFKAIVSYKF